MISIDIIKTKGLRLSILSVECYSSHKSFVLLQLLPRRRGQHPEPQALEERLAAGRHRLLQPQGGVVLHMGRREFGSPDRLHQGLGSLKRTQLQENRHLDI